MSWDFNTSFGGTQFNPWQQSSTLFKPLSCSTTKEPSSLRKGKDPGQQEKPSWKSLWVRWMAGDEVSDRPHGEGREAQLQSWFWSEAMASILAYMSVLISSPPLWLIGISEESSFFSQGWRLQQRTRMWTCHIPLTGQTRLPRAPPEGSPGFDLDSNHQVQECRENSLLTWDTDKIHLRLSWQCLAWGVIHTNPR